MYRDVPKVVYETAIREEDETIYQTEYDIRTRDVPVTTYVDGYKSYDSGDGVESEPGYGYAAPVYEPAPVYAAPAYDPLPSYGYNGYGDLGIGNLFGGHGHAHAQVESGYYTSDSSDDYHQYPVTTYVTEEYKVPKKVPVNVTTEVPYQVATTVYEKEAYTVDHLVPYEVAVEVPY